MNLEQVKSSVGQNVCVKTSQGVVCGKLTFAGENENFPSWGFQVTVDNMPLPNIDPVNVSLQVSRKPIQKKEVTTETITDIYNEAVERFGSTIQKLSD